MASILIKDTTSEQREPLVRESLGDDYDVGCGFEVAHTRCARLHE